MKKLIKWTKVTDVILILLGVLFIVEGFIKLYQGGESVPIYFIIGIWLALIIPAGKRKMDTKQKEELEKMESENE